LPERIYLDHAATTAMLPAAKTAVAEAMERWANPSSPHAEGRAAHAALEDARARIKAALGWTGDLIFTSGASEALAIALGRAKVERRLISAVEHDAVFRAAPDAQILPIGPHVQVDLDRLERALAEGGTAAVAIQDVNSETGKAQPLAEAGAIIRAAGGLLIADCAQSAGKRALPDADMAIVSAHKLGGPPGVGALLVRDLAKLEATGGQEQGYRGGTENLPGLLGFAAAVERAEEIDRSYQTLAHPLIELVNRLWDEGGREVGRANDWSPYILAVAMPGLRATAQLIQFDRRGIAVSAGSACSSGSLKPSRALAAFGVPAEEAERTIRISIGWTTRPEDIEAFRDAWLEIEGQARARAA
jgi:cysteine desulfurase